MAAAMGRTFVADDAVAGAPRVVVLSQAYWQNHLDGRPDVVGQTLMLDGERATIVGVLPRMPGVTEFFVPLVLADARDDRSARTLFVMARLKDGATLESARAEMLGIGQALEREFPATNRGWDVEHAAAARGIRRTAGTAGVRAACRHRPDGSPDRLREHRQPAARARRRSSRRIGACGLRSALAAGESCVNCSSNAHCWRVLGGLLSLVISRWTITSC